MYDLMKVSGNKFLVFYFVTIHASSMGLLERVVDKVLLYKMVAFEVFLNGVGVRPHTMIGLISVCRL